MNLRPWMLVTLGSASLAAAEAPAGGKAEALAPRKPAVVAAPAKRAPGPAPAPRLKPTTVHAPAAATPLAPPATPPRLAGPSHTRAGGHGPAPAAVGGPAYTVHRGPTAGAGVAAIPHP